MAGNIVGMCLTLLLFTFLVAVDGDDAI